MSVFRNLLGYKLPPLYLVKDGVVSDKYVGTMTFQKTGGGNNGQVIYGSQNQPYILATSPNWSSYQWYGNKYIPFGKYKTLCVDMSCTTSQGYARLWWRSKQLDNDMYNIVDLIPVKNQVYSRKIEYYDIPTTMVNELLVLNLQNLGRSTDEIRIYNMWLE